MSESSMSKLVMALACETDSRERRVAANDPEGGGAELEVVEDAMGPVECRMTLPMHPQTTAQWSSVATHGYSALDEKNAHDHKSDRKRLPTPKAVGTIQN